MLTVQVRLFSPVAYWCDCRCSCADGVSLKCLSSERTDVVLEGVWPSRQAHALATALTLFFKVTSEGGAFRRMCGRLIKCCSLPRLMGQIAHYAGLYIMSNCLLLSLPANEPPSYIWMWFCKLSLRQERFGCVQERLVLQFSLKLQLCLLTFHLVDIQGNMRFYKFFSQYVFLLDK